MVLRSTCWFRFDSSSMIRSALEEHRHRFESIYNNPSQSKNHPYQLIAWVYTSFSVIYVANMLSKQRLPHKSTYIFLLSFVRQYHHIKKTLLWKCVHRMSVAVCADGINEMYKNKRKLPSQRTHYRWSSIAIANLMWVTKWNFISIECRLHRTPFVVLTFSSSRFYSKSFITLSVQSK